MCKENVIQNQKLNSSRVLKGSFFSSTFDSEEKLKFMLLAYIFMLMLMGLGLWLCCWGWLLLCCFPKTSNAWGTEEECWLIKDPNWKLPKD